MDSGHNLGHLCLEVQVGFGIDSVPVRVNIKYPGTPLHNEVRYRGRMKPPGFRLTRVQVYLFHFLYRKKNKFIITVDERKDFLNLPKELRAMMIKIMVGASYKKWVLE
ncbi:MAG: hypothetical protein AAB628_01940 [Patescibacteria group bacterium]